MYISCLLHVVRTYLPNLILEQLQKRGPTMAASAPVIRDSASNKKLVQINDLKPYLTSVSGVGKFCVIGHLDTARCGTITSMELGVGIRHVGSTLLQLYPHSS